MSRPAGGTYKDISMNREATLTINGEAIDKLGAARAKILDQLSQVIVGQTHVIDELLVSLFSRGGSGFVRSLRAWDMGPANS